MILPEKFEERMRTMLGNEYDDFKTAFEDEPIYTGLRVNTLRTNAIDKFIKEFGTQEPVPWCDSGFYVDKAKISGNHPFHLAGLYYFQEPSAMCAAQGLPISESDYVLDLCAAPGGKTTQAGAKLNNTGILVANEIVKNRSAILSGNVERMGLTNTIVTNETPDKLAKKYPLFFDKIIVDAPCSGEGMFRKEAQAITEWSIEHTVSCGERQRNILKSALAMLKPGGMLMYSTCTFAPEENEKVAAWLIEQGTELVEIPKLSMLSDGVTEWGGGEKDMHFARRIFPHKNRGEGHFAALFKKSGDLSTEMQKTDLKTWKTKKNNNSKRDNTGLESALKLYREFEKKVLNITLDGEPILFGDRLYLKPHGIDVDKIKVVRCGLELGTVKKNRFEPAHALALALDASKLKSYVDISLDDERLYKYLSGDVIPSDADGWCVVCVEGYALGWGKASGGMVKNHYPKGLRLKGKR